MTDDLPDWIIIVRGGAGELPPAGQYFSGAYGKTLEEAATGVPHGMIRVSTVGAIRAGGGSVEVRPEPTRGGAFNFRHVDIMEGSDDSSFSEPITNPVPKESRIR